MSKLQQDIQDTLIELVDNRYKVVIEPSKPFSISISKINFTLDSVKEYLHQSYDIMELNGYKISKVTVNNHYYNLEVKELNKDKGIVEDTLNTKNWEDLWDSIDFCLFSSSGEIGLLSGIKLFFIEL